MPARVLVLGVDAGDKDLILRWADAGVLPTFRSLLAGSVWGTVTNPVGVFVGAVWPSFFTGVSPAHHGRYCFRQVRPGRYETVRIRAGDVKAEPFWLALGRAGRRVAIIDVPKTALAAGLSGIQLVDWATHDPALDRPASEGRPIPAVAGAREHTA